MLIDEIVKSWQANREINFDFTPDELMDIALLSLKNTVRFNGVCYAPYNVLTHSWMVALLASDFAKVAGASESEQLMAQYRGMLHDFGEVVVGDIVYPLKHTEFEQTYRPYQELEDAFVAFASGRFGVPWKKTESVAQFVSQADNLMGTLETFGVTINGYSSFSYLKPWFDSILERGLDNKTQFKERVFQLVQLISNNYEQP